MRFFLVLTNLYIAYVAADHSAQLASASSSLTDDQKDVQIHAAVKSLMVAIESHLNETDGDTVALSKRNYYGSHPYFMNQYYNRAYGIVRAGCYSHRRFYKRSAGSKEVQDIKVMQKQLAVAWDDVISEYNSLSRRAVNVLDDGLRSIAGKTKAGRLFNKDTDLPSAQTGGSAKPKADDPNLETVSETSENVKIPNDDAEELLPGQQGEKKTDESTVKKDGTSEEPPKDVANPKERTRLQKFMRASLWILGSSIIFLILFRVVFGRSPPPTSQFTEIDGIPAEHLDASSLDDEVTFG